MTPLQDHSQITLGVWLGQLSEQDLKTLLVSAAEQHPTLKITDPQGVADNWQNVIKRGGFQTVPKYYRDFLAQQYLRNHDAMMA